MPEATIRALLPSHPPRHRLQQACIKTRLSEGGEGRGLFCELVLLVPNAALLCLFHQPAGAIPRNSPAHAPSRNVPPHRPSRSQAEPSRDTPFLFQSLPRHRIASQGCPAGVRSMDDPAPMSSTKCSPTADQVPGLSRRRQPRCKHSQACFLYFQDENNPDRIASQKRPLISLKPLSLWGSGLSGCKGPRVWLWFRPPPLESLQEVIRIKPISARKNRWRHWHCPFSSESKRFVPSHGSLPQTWLRFVVLGWRALFQKVPAPWDNLRDFDMYQPSG